MERWSDGVMGGAQPSGELRDRWFKRFARSKSNSTSLHLSHLIPFLFLFSPLILLSGCATTPESPNPGDLYSRGAQYPGAVKTVLSGCTMPDAASRDDPWFAQDKAKHFIAAAAISSGMTFLADEAGSSEAESRGWALGITMTIGAGKELYDDQVKDTYWSWRDLAWDLIGALSGNLAVSRF